MILMIFGKKYLKDSRIEFAGFGFYVVFISTFFLSNRTPKITPIMTPKQTRQH